MPLVFVLMSGKSKDDYAAVFNTAKEILSATTKLKEFMVDFEVAVWSALGECFMSGKSKDDYAAVFNAAKELLLVTTKLKEFMVDFEVAVWSDPRECFPGITIKGKLICLSNQMK